MNQTGLPDRFWRKVHGVDSSTQCWDWLGANNGNGYGRFYMDGRWHYSHRLTFLAYYGAPALAGKLVDHLCHNHGCVNPNHLRAVTGKENGENLPLSRANKSGYRGVSFNRKSGTWEAYVCPNRSKVHLGYFADPAEAGRAASAARGEIFTHSIETLGASQDDTAVDR